MISEFELKTSKIVELRRRWNSCKKCMMSMHRHSVVQGRGNPNSKVFILTSAPGKLENVEGVPIVGKESFYLNTLLQAAGLNERKVWIETAIACRPTARSSSGRINRDPALDEIENCRPRLEAVLNIVNPNVIVLLGRVAQSVFFGSSQPSYPFNHEGKVFLYAAPLASYDFNTNNKLQTGSESWMNLGLNIREIANKELKPSFWTLPLR